jgi:translation initiation factor 1 (eIF-1/SUI1)
MALIEIFEGATDLESLAPELKSARRTGSNVHIELQADPEERVRELPNGDGFQSEDNSRVDSLE